MTVKDYIKAGKGKSQKPAFKFVKASNGIKKILSYSYSYDNDLVLTPKEFIKILPE